jgi:hypothetical protein
LVSPISKFSIVSISANEFLLAQPKDTVHPSYYVFLPNGHAKFSSLKMAGNRGGIETFGNPNWAKLGSKRTDRIIIDFGNQFPPYLEYGNLAISEVINNRLLGFYEICISHLPKNKQKYLRKRMGFVINNNFFCYPLNKSAVDRGLELFSQFVSKHNCKSNIRNTVNDVLILASAIEYQKPLLTEDSLLNRFAAEIYDVKTIEQSDNNIIIDFSKVAPVNRSCNLESKGYINRGWNYSIRKRKAY